MRVSLKYGMSGLGIYWCIIEMLYEQGGYIPLINIESIAYELHSQCDCITDVLRNYDLFKFEGELFYSESVLRRLNERKEKSNKARESAITRWGDANAMRTHSDRNANKGKKRKKKKRIKESREKIFIPPTLEEVEAYFIENGYTKESGRKAFNSYSVANWIDSKGNQVLNWKQKMINVWFKDENKVNHEVKKITPQFQYGPES